MTKKWAKIIDNKTKACEVGIGTDNEYYRSHGYRYIDVEQGDNGSWYEFGYAPIIINPSEVELEIKRLKEELQKYDYIGIKIATGCATVEEYADKIAYCEGIRNKIRRLQGEVIPDEEGAV